MGRKATDRSACIATDHFRAVPLRPYWGGGLGEEADQELKAEPGGTQSFQKSLIKEYALNHIAILNVILGTFLNTKDCWKLGGIGILAWRRPGGWRSVPLVAAKRGGVP